MIDWRTDGAWRYQTLPRTDDNTPLGGLAPMASLWLGRRENDTPPPWTAFELNDFAGFWGWVGVYDFHAAPVPRLHVRLWGSKLTNMFGRDMTRKDLFRVNDDRENDAQTLTHSDFDFACHIIETDCIGLNFGPHKLAFGGLRTYREAGFALSSDGRTNDGLLFVGELIKAPGAD